MLKTPSLVIFQARRASGKTHLQLHLVQTLSRGGSFDWVRVVSPTAFNGVWAGAVGRGHVHEELDEGEILALLDRQASAVASGVQNRGLLVFDDCLGAIRPNSPLWTRLAASSRHYQLTIWISTQWMMKLPPVVRANADYLFVMGPTPARTVKALYEEFNPHGIADEAALAAFLRTATADFGAALFDVAACRVLATRAPARVDFTLRQ